MRFTGTIRKWTEKGWGIVNSYQGAEGTPTRFFVHLQNANKEIRDVLALGIRITFDVGEPRNPGELPTALNIGLASPTPSQSETQTVKTVPPISTDKTTDGEESGQ
jgi:hypothetical protein